LAVGSVDWQAEGQGLLASVSDADHNPVGVVTGIVNLRDVGMVLVWRKDDLWVNRGGSGGGMSSSGASDGKSSRDGGGDAEQLCDGQ
jgi:hypothetical protein